MLSAPAKEFGNDEIVEYAWATRAIEHSELYFNVLCSVDTRWLHLTPHDDLIYAHFKQDFPHMDISLIIEDEMKNEANKIKWRIFCDKYKRIIEDYNFGTLIRIDVSGDYSEENTILVARIQFYAIEIARNRQGLNNSVKKHHKCGAKGNLNYL